MSVHAFARLHAEGAGRRGRIGAAALGLLLAAGLTVAGGTAPTWPVRTSGTGATAVAELPQQVSQIGWTRMLPLYYPESFDNAWAVAGPGLVLITDGPEGPMVQALDGATGDTAWTYRRVGARILRLRASPDGEIVYVSSTMEGSFMSDFRIQAIDARTGELLGLAAGRDVWLTRATTAGLLIQRLDRSLHSLSPGDMSEQWSWEGPADARCSLASEPHPALTVIVLLIDCRSTQELVGLDPDTGAEVWSRAADDIGELYADAAADLVVARLREFTDSPRLTFHVLDAATGEPLTEIRSDHWLEVHRGYGCCAGTEETPTPADARTGQPLGPPIQDISRELADEIGTEPWYLQAAVLPQTLVLAGRSMAGEGQRREVTVAVYPFAPAAEPIRLRAEVPVPAELGLDGVREGSHPVVVAGPGALFVLAPAFSTDDQHPGGGLTVIGLQ